MGKRGSATEGADAVGGGSPRAGLQAGKAGRHRLYIAAACMFAEGVLRGWRKGSLKRRRAATARGRQRTYRRNNLGDSDKQWPRFQPFSSCCAFAARPGLSLVGSGHGLTFSR